MAITSRAALTAYALRSLGDDVIEVNVSEDQASDRLDEALEWFQDYHSDGVEKLWFKHKLRGSTVKLDTTNAAAFIKGEKVVFSNSGAHFTLYDATDSQTLRAHSFNDTINDSAGLPVIGDIATGTNSGETGTVTEVTIGDIDNKWIPLTDAIIGVVNVLPINQNYSGSSFNMFDVRYQIMLNDMFSLTNINMLYYTQVQSHLSMINFLLTPAITFEWTRHKNELHLNLDWAAKTNPDDYVVVEAYAILDPTEWTGVYGDRWLKEYYIALVKRQWGTNLKKFGGMQLPGGVIMNGQIIFDEAQAEIADLKHRVMYDHQLPIDFMTG